MITMDPLRQAANLPGPSVDDTGPALMASMWVVACLASLCVLIAMMSRLQTRRVYRRVVVDWDVLLPLSLVRLRKLVRRLTPKRLMIQ